MINNIAINPLVCLPNTSNKCSAANKAKSANAPASSGNTDIQVKLSPETQNAASAVLEMLREADTQRAVLQMKLDRLRDQMEANQEAMEAKAEALRKQRLALRIAMRIAAGDNVPAQDRAFLLEQSPGMYMMANLAQSQNENPRDYDSLLSDEDRQGADTIAEAVGAGASRGSSGGGASPSAVSAGAASSGTAE